MMKGSSQASHSNQPSHTRSMPDIRVAFYCSSVAWGGLEMNTVRYANWMQERGWKVIVFAVENSPIHQQAAKDNLEVICIRRNKKYADILNALRVAELFKKHHIRICWFRDTRDFSLLGIAKKLSGNQFKLLYQQAMQFGVSKKDIFHTIRFRRIDAWVSTLNFLASQVREMTRFNAQQIHVVPLGVDTHRLHASEDLKMVTRIVLGIPQDVVLLGIIGRIDPLKGQHVAINALKFLHERGKQFHLLIMGESTLNEGDHYSEGLHATVNHAGLNEYVHFRPYSPEVFQFYHAIDLFTLCSKGETFGTVTIEAMACGKTILATNSSGTPEILDHGKCGELFEPGNHRMLAEKIIALTDAPERCIELAANAKTRFQQEYAKEVSVDRMQNILNELLSH